MPKSSNSPQTKPNGNSSLNTTENSSKYSTQTSLSRPNEEKHTTQFRNWSRAQNNDIEGRRPISSKLGIIAGQVVEIKVYPLYRGGEERPVTTPRYMAGTAIQLIGSSNTLDWLDAASIPTTEQNVK